MTSEGGSVKRILALPNTSSVLQGAPPQTLSLPVTMTNNSMQQGGSVTVTPTGHVHSQAPPLQIPISVAASLMASVKPQVEINPQSSVTVSLATPTSTPQVLKEEVISSGVQSSPPSVIVTPAGLPVQAVQVSNGNGFKNSSEVKANKAVEVTPILDNDNYGISEAKRAKFD